MMTLENTAKEYSKYCDINLESKVQLFKDNGSYFSKYFLQLEPVNKCIDDMFARLEEFQTMMSFVTQDQVESVKVLTSLLDHREEFEDLCIKIDSLECLVSHIKNNLDKLEDDINKAEANLNISEPTAKVANIFTPLFVSKLSVT